MMGKPASPGPTGRTRARWLVGVPVMLLLVVIAIVTSRLTRTAEISYAGRVVQVPLPAWSMPLSTQDEATARYLTLGDPDLGSVVDWGEFNYVEQLGSGHLLTSEELRLEIVTRKRSRWLTEMSLQLRPQG